MTSTATKPRSNLAWTETSPDCVVYDRLVAIRDGGSMFCAALPDGMSIGAAIDDYLRGYDVSPRKIVGWSTPRGEDAQAVADGDWFHADVLDLEDMVVESVSFVVEYGEVAQ